VCVTNSTRSTSRTVVRCASTANTMMAYSLG